MASDLIQSAYRRAWWSLVVRGLIGLTLGVCISAASEMSLRWMALPARRPAFAVMSNLHVESLMRPASDSALNPPKTTE